VKAKIRATSTVDGILNATVDSSATAVANNLTVSMGPNGLLIGDVTQFAYADVTARSKVTDVTLNNYTGLGSLTRPIVSSVATAVGNNASISVKAPVVSAP
jgi:Na+/H+ antiporter NhaD/arsenite permease-like protein